LLKLRRAVVRSVEGGDGRIARLTVRLEAGEERAALAYPALTGAIEAGDEVVVNVEAHDLALGSGGFDLVCVNLTRGLAGEGAAGAHVMKLNYTPLQHAVRPVEEGLELAPSALALPVAVLAVHGQLPAAAFALERRSPGARVGFVQTAGGALAGALSNTVAELIERELLCGHVTVAPCFGAAEEAITVEGALHAAAERLGWEAALIGPGPGIIGSASALGHGGIEALHSAHAAIALGCPVVLAPRLSSGDSRERHYGLSHHSATVLGLLLRAVDVPVPDAIGAEARAQLEHAAAARPDHRLLEVSVDELLAPYRESGLPTTTMGRDVDADTDFFRAALGAGAALAKKLREGA
jgi:hypothetical protein